MISVLFVALSFVFSSSRIGKATDDEMTISEECGASQCILNLSGIITANTPKKLKQKYPDGLPSGNKVYLESPGGSLKAALEMGRYFREMGFDTYVGSLFNDESTKPYSNQCNSSCAYAFLGGNDRGLSDEGSKIGIHRFYLSSGGQALVEASKTIDTVQNFTSQLVSYIIQMGVDARFFVNANNTSSKEMEFPDKKTLTNLGVLPPSGFSNFYIEPYKNGVLAISKEMDKVIPYGTAPLEQLTAYCKNKVPHLLFTGGAGPQDNDATPPLSFWLNGASIYDDATFSVSNKKVKFRKSGGAVLHDVTISTKIIKRLLKQNRLVFGFEYSGARGGSLTFVKDLSEQDKKMLATAFRLCI